MKMNQMWKRNSEGKLGHVQTQRNGEATPNWSRQDKSLSAKRKQSTSKPDASSPPVQSANYQGIRYQRWQSKLLPSASQLNEKFKILGTESMSSR